ncbi:putative porin [Maribacter sp. MMG018]|uniref:putative porin n=1 Tax=Maribacter sp. MMG018 TaxID=2822688 RepID=UPI001B36975B|nr:putative porin [Maribacter sp. MMG018]MBQ4915776.1 putative porin [Maribacter sp. MMG018]
MRYFLLLVFSFSALTLFSQERRPPRQKNDSLSVNNVKTLPKSAAKKDSVSEVTIRDYKIISFARDTTFLDTTLTVQKEYKYNYLRQDDFELMPLSNIGQTYNKLGVNAERATMYPQLGAMAKHFNYREVEDINYYNVATPMTDILFKTTLEEGQLLDAMLTFNTSRRLNFSIGYKGHRSLGKYNSNQIQSGNFTATSNYMTENGRYALRAHIAAQDILSEENAGLTDKELQFESGDPEFTDRAKVDVRFDDADNKILGKRYYLDHTYKLVRKRKDSSIVEKTSLAIGHVFNYETKYYQFMQDSGDSYFGDAILSTINDKASLKTFYNQVNLEFYNSVLGRLKGNINLFNYDYFFNSTLISEDGDKIDSKLNGAEVAIGADYEKKIGGFLVNGSFKYNVSGDLSGNILDAVASYDLNDKYRFKVKVHSSARMPNFNFLLYQSEYLNYNWQNTDVFKKERINSLEFSLDSKLLGGVSVKYTNLDNYTYFGTDPSLNLEEGLENANIKPYQEEAGISYLKVKYNKEFTLGKFALNNTFMYQAVSQDADVLNVPQLVTRNTLYFSSDVFKKAMYLQTGITFKYFSKYNMNGYNPVLGEFFVQDKEELGGYPLLDFFINARIQQTRIFLKAEHFNSLFGDYNYYSAPNYPYRDFVIRFGLVWNFFS